MLAPAGAANPFAARLALVVRHVVKHPHQRLGLEQIEPMRPFPGDGLRFPIQDGAERVRGVEPPGGLGTTGRPDLFIPQPDGVLILTQGGLFLGTQESIFERRRHARYPPAGQGRPDLGGRDVMRLAQLLRLL